VVLLVVGTLLVVLNWAGAPLSKPPSHAPEGKPTPVVLPFVEHSHSAVTLPLPANTSGGDYPLVSILTLSRGQWWCARNVLMNACYQNYPQSSIELLIGESSFLPSPFIDADIQDLECNISLRTFWFNISSRHMNLGGMRNFLAHKAKGEFLVMMDNDDIYHPRYVETVVRTFQRNRSLAILEAKPHMKASQNADGSLVAFPGWNPETGGHLTSLTKEITLLCDYTDNYVNEEYGMLFCARKHNMGFGLIRMDDPSSSYMLLLKVQSGLSITDQVWYVNRHQLARMRPSDWTTKLAHLVWYFEQIHELQRPPHVPFMPRIGMPYPGEEPENAKSAREFRAPRHVHELFWDEFHKDHPDFLGDGSLNSYCKDYALMPGVQLSSTTTQKHVESDEECCSYCRGLTSAASTCVAMSFNSETRECAVEVRNPPFEKGFFPGRTWSPETVLTIRTAALVSLDSAISG
jgi:hypothetical protein